MDLIDRQAAIDEIRKCRFLVDAIEKIRGLPSARPERKKGRWINHRNDNGHNIADCSECRNAIQWFDGDEKPRFCCMCGAWMGGEEDGND